MYCEDNCADEVEHHHPKAFFPELVFAWTNFLFACARCNRRKSTKFPLFATATSTAVTLARVDPQQPASPAGTSVLLDPRRDDPDTFLRLDLRDTFWFRVVPPKGTPDHVRAVETIKVLGLNDRDELPRQRRVVYRSHLSHLHDAAAARRDPMRHAEIPHIQSAVRGLSCAVVWHEMKRRRHDLPEVRDAFDAIPEALTW